MNLTILTLIFQIIIILLLIYLLFRINTETAEKTHDRLTEITTQLKSFQLSTNQRFDFFSEKLENFRLKLIESNTESFTHNRKELTESLSRVSNKLEKQFEKLVETNDKKLEEIRTRVEKRLKETIEENNKVFSNVIKNIGELKATNNRIVEISKDINQLNEILSAPKLRGNFGEFELNNMLSQIIPSSHYQLQYDVGNGAKVDAAIQLDRSILCIDAKFPLENFRKALNCDESEKTQSFLKQFSRDVSKHIETIRSKYIIPRKTLDFAFMFIPAENVYYQVLLDEELHQYALNNKIIPVSPNSLYAYLQVLAIGFRNMKIQKEARKLQNIILELGKNFDEFKDHYKILGKHLRNAQNQYLESEKDVSKFSNVISNIETKAEFKEIEKGNK